MIWKMLGFTSAYVLATIILSLIFKITIPEAFAIFSIISFAGFILASYLGLMPEDDKTGIINEFMGGIAIVGRYISTIINTTLLFFVYFIGIGITSISMKLRRKQLLDMSGEAHWNDIEQELFNEHHNSLLRGV